MPRSRPLDEYRKAYKSFLEGHSLREISEELRIPLRTLKEWSRKNNWQGDREQLRYAIQNQLISATASDVKELSGRIKRVLSFLLSVCEDVSEKALFYSTMADYQYQTSGKVDEPLLKVLAVYLNSAIYLAAALKDVLKTALSAEELLSREEALEEAWEHYRKTLSLQRDDCER